MYHISLNNVPLEKCPPLNSVPFFEKAWYIKKEHYSNFCTFEIASLVNVTDIIQGNTVFSYSFSLINQVISCALGSKINE